MKKILEYIKLPFEILFLLIFDTNYGLPIFIVGAICLFLWYGITYQPGRYCKYCGEGAEYRSYIYYHPCKSSNSGKHNIEFYWKKPENGHTRADELSKYIE